MEFLTSTVQTLNGIVWGPLMLILILGTGFYLMVGLKLYPVRNIANAFRLLLRGRHPEDTHDEDRGQITPFNALMTSLSATIGTGNIAGVATAITIGGPGALFWMWCTALVGMATKYAEAVCAVHYREVDEDGNYCGGPMYYIKNGLGEKWKWLAVAFAFFAAIAGFGMGNTVQANSVADVMESTFSISPTITSVVMVVLVGLVLLGGVKRIASVAGFLVPIMAVSYILLGLVILVLNIADIPAAIALIVESAFTGTAAQGGFAGAGIMLAIQFGVARGVFSNEAGLGSAPIAHAAAQTDNPVKQGTIAMLGTFIDTLIVCSITGLAIVLTGMWTTGEGGASLTAAAFSAVIPKGDVLVSVSLCFFAFTTILGWSYYGERCAVYLFGTGALVPFRVLWVAAIPLGAMAQLNFIWLLADTLNALMALPNLMALLLLSPIIFKLTKEARSQ
ncbi:MAG: sodium:alanine symporter family protein [Oceanicoccus sp.]|uniref:alanine/glycine:cation symporter family protein n=1 Tax=Oceanicoccus sp. TaxID=2691044 RepID=UPI00261F8B80|nr:sodium:alanine symporter family protein [Oceanicoccus sp.]MCP3908194.1 sodium:alanine symporter family protein [Oceanicoccus sp.]